MEHVKIEQRVVIANGTEDIPLPINITVITKNAPLHSAVITRIQGLPKGSFLTRGVLDNFTGMWVLRHSDLNEPLLLYLPVHTSGKFPVTISSTLGLVKNKSITAREGFEVRVKPETDSGHMEIKSPYFTSKCFHQDEKSLRFTVEVKLDDNDGSEEVEYMELKGLPKGVRVDPGRILGNEQGFIIFGRELPNFEITSEKNFPAFEMMLDAKIKEKSTGNKNSVTKQIAIVPCSGAYKSGNA